MLKKMSIVIFITLFIFLIISLVFSYYDSIAYKQKSYFKINSDELGKVIFKYVSPSGFYGDGEDVYIYNVDVNNLNKILKRSNWRKLDNDINKIINISYIKEAKNFKFPNSGYYRLYDKSEKKFKTFEEYFYLPKYESFNYILVVLDFHNNNLIYFEEDT